MRFVYAFVEFAPKANLQSGIYANGNKALLFRGFSG